MALALFISLAGCDDDPVETVCNAKSTMSCACPGGGTGTRTCKTDGSGWGPCYGCAKVDAAVDGALPDLARDTAPPPDIDPCGPGTTLCGKVCVDLKKDAANCGACATACSAGEVCASGKCALACPPAQKKCGGGDAGAPYCADLQADQKNCGACANACKTGHVCSAGKCALACQAGLFDCSGSCVNLLTDLANCGACATACKTGHVCSAGKCALSCQPGLTDCSGACVDLQADLKNCGACANACKPGHVCSAGKCALWCQAGLTDCSGVCVNLKTDLKNCGGCASACKAGHVCSAGKCALSCQAGLFDCSGACANLQTDLANCGACANKCKGGHVCTAGKCVLSCQAGLTDCSGACVNLQIDPGNCGNCANKCKAGYVCSAGQCKLSCKSGQTDCSGSCVDLQTDSNNCGACATKCKQGEVCASGKCVTACGNGAINVGEQCDGTNLGGKTCVSLGYLAGTLTCNKICGFDISGCHYCGNGKIEGSEQCDGTNLGGKTCKTQGHDGGKIACGKKCAFDLSACHKCTDKLKNGDETDVDCGGAVCSGCAVGKKCTAHADCAKGTLCDKTAGTCRHPKTCKDLLAALPTTKSGTYSIDLDGSGSGAAISVVCDMSTASGGWTLVGLETKTDTQNLRFLGVETGTPANLVAGKSALIGKRFEGSYKELRIDWKDGKLYAQFTPSKGIFVNSKVLSIAVSGFSSNESTLASWVKSAGGAHFCRAAVYNSIRPGDTSWAIKPTSDKHTGCGCNSGSWVGNGAYYAGTGSGCTYCGCHPGSFSGTKSSGQPKGGFKPGWRTRLWVR